MRKMDRSASIVLRAFFISAGLAIAGFGAFALHDGDATLGIPGRNIQSASHLVHLNAWPELLITAVLLGVLASLFMLAGVSPRLFSKTPVVPLLVAVAFVLSVAVPFLASGK